MLKRNSLILLFAGFIVFSLISCGAEYNKFIKEYSGEYISSIELKSMIDKNEVYKLVDLRLIGDYNNGHIQSAINIPYIKPEALYHFVNKPFLIILYSNIDTIQKNTYMSLAKGGATNVRILVGGLHSWSYGFVTE
ncbi:MAG: hypothetical protein A2Y33_11410 [Spirochaetes bacterium GWF1_51_8]|nr:MAG: hypothetical protein A2Y33_11410 [Spirochaetes bacterium GWF1_51_8]